MGFFSDLGGTIKARLNPKTIVGEMLETLTDRVVPQGAAEVAQALFSHGSAYVPYGPGQAHLPVEPAETTGVEPAASPEPVASPQEQYQANLAMYAARSNHHDQTPSL